MVGVLEWETGDKGEGHNGEFCRACFMLFKTKPNISCSMLLGGQGKGRERGWGSLSFRGAIGCETRRERRVRGRESWRGGGREKGSAARAWAWAQAWAWASAHWSRHHWPGLSSASRRPVEACTMTKAQQCLALVPETKAPKIISVI